MIPFYGTTETQSATANITSDGWDVSSKIRLGTGSVTVNSVGFNTADATVRIQHSNDGVNFENLDLTDASVGLMAIATGTATQTLTPITFIAVKYFRIVYTKNTNSAGTITVILNVY